jgi:hypothetical protein
MITVDTFVNHSRAKELEEYVSQRTLSVRQLNITVVLVSSGTEVCALDG